MMLFQENFVWGVSTSAYQIEGAAHADGKGESIWDQFSHRSGTTRDGHNGDVTCDHYHRYREDVALMKELGVKAYRFSIAWTRILPNGVGEVNTKGIEFYGALIDELLAAGIEPYVTLFHWDYPAALQQKGGWLNEESPRWFEEYVRVVFAAYSDRVTHFMTFNEMQCFLGDHLTGMGAPGVRYPEDDVVRMGHNVLKAHGLAVRAFRELVPHGKIGVAPTCTPAIPASDRPEDIEAARRQMFDVTKDTLTWNVSWWSDPILLGRYPEETEGFRQFGRYLPDGWREDMKLISEPIDFYGQNIYHGARYRASDACTGQDIAYEKVVHSRNTSRTYMTWPITPEAVYWGARFLYERYGMPIIITENGMACHDTVSLDGRVHDPNRIDYIHRYLLEIHRAIEDGVQVMGYMYWSLMDNYEWTSGYLPRFGLVYVNYDTQERIKKDSFTWYSEVIRTQGENCV